MPLWKNINWYFANYHKERFLSGISLCISPEAVQKEKMTSAQRLRKDVLHFCTSEAIYSLFLSLLVFVAWFKLRTGKHQDLLSSTDGFILYFMLETQAPLNITSII